MSKIFKSSRSRDVMRGCFERVLEDVAPVTSRNVTTRFGSTHVLVAGNAEGPPLVVLHGAMANSALAIREGEHLFERFCVYAVDVVGFSAMGEDVRLSVKDDSYGRWLEDVMDGLGLDKAHVYGVSYGGFVALKLAQICSERIDRLVLVVPASIVATPALMNFTSTGVPMLLYRTEGSQLQYFRQPTLICDASEDVNFPGAKLLARAPALLPQATD